MYDISQQLRYLKTCICTDVIITLNIHQSVVYVWAAYLSELDHTIILNIHVLNFLNLLIKTFHLHFENIITNIMNIFSPL